MSRNIKKKALLVGINYRHSEQLALKGCVNDVKCMKDVLISKYGYLPQNVRVLTDEAEVDLRFAPTRKNILEGLRWLVADAVAGDQRFFQFSGHGMQIRDVDGDEWEDGKDEAILTCDEVAIVDDEILRVFAGMRRDVKLTALFDCCHSGTVADLMYTFKLGQGSNTYQMQIANRRNRNLPSNVVVLSACMDPQTAADSKFDGKWILTPEGQWIYEWATAMGAFTYYFLKTLEELDKDGEGVSDGVIVHQLLAAVTDKLKNNGFTQIPQFSCTRPNAIGEPFCI